MVRMKTKKIQFVRFYDYQYHDTMGSTDGYSGRIGDLFVNMNIIKAEFGRTTMLMI